MCPGPGSEVDLMSPRGLSPQPWIIRAMLGPTDLALWIWQGFKGGGAKYWYSFPSSNPIHQGPFSQACAKEHQGTHRWGINRFQGV